ncbi:MAG: TolC family outer membrane protein [Gallionella sp.]|nr:TolC family outer membrane protein [Gallionella sp.]
MLTIALLLACAPAAHALDLVQGYRLALENDATYQVALAANQAGHEAVPQALAQLLPNLSASGSRSKNATDSQSPGFLGQMNHSFSRYTSASTTLALRQPLFRKYNFALYKQAQAQEKNADAVLDIDRQELLMRLSGAYFEALMAQEQLAFVLAQKDAYSGQLQSATKAFAAGAGTRTDIDDAQARYDLGLAQELEARQNIGYTRRQLQVIVNQPVESLATLDAGRMELLPPTPNNLDEWIARSEGNNAELRALQANIEAAQQELEKAKSGHYPTADLFVQRSKTESDTNYTINSQYLTTAVGVQFNIPIWSGGAVNSQMRQATANLEKTKQQYEARRREISQQVRKEFQNVTEGILKVKSLEQAERSSGQAVFSNQKGLQAGTRSQIDILNAQQQQMNVRRDLAQARYQYLMARVRLQGLMNSLNEDEMARINSWLVEADR